MESAGGRDPHLFSQRVVEYISHEMEPASFVQAHPLRLAAALAANGDFCTRVLFHQNSNIPNLANLLAQLKPFFATQLSSQSLELSPEALSQVQLQGQPQVPTTGAQAETNQDNVSVASESTRTHNQTPASSAVPGTAAKKSRKNWSVYEGEMLAAQMKIHEDMLLDKSTGIKYRTMSATEKFEMISARLRSLDPPVDRTASQIEDKWDRMTGDFKKVYDWDKHPPSGKPTYWEMGPDTKKEHNLPPAFTKVLFESLLWMKERASVEPPVVLDTAATPEPATHGPATPEGSPDSNDDDSAVRDTTAYSRKDANGKGNGKGNKRDRNGVVLSETLRANNEDTNKMHMDCENLRDARHREMKDLRERELKLEEEKLKVVEKSNEVAAQTGKGLVEALQGLANAVNILARK
ncbi:hypothetical protein KFL_000660240 [Klebsormidium nitens]|uniref:Myb/SANT-like DNA-binding domain-containing protein n=1 Tax=Klebsormidium nitens TaxID=105231 RepID=A0A1Y1HUR9_KLENI|nr:hypothetical protein KFL_000660240 [Klebsormidium nitens]|eukprot:GAQ80929.1 hypothetical protein KFL_000660240 [Klebsormidium nitens]